MVDELIGLSHWMSFVQSYPCDHQDDGVRIGAYGVRGNRTIENYALGWERPRILIQMTDINIICPRLGGLKKAVRGKKI